MMQIAYNDFISTREAPVLGKFEQNPLRRVLCFNFIKRAHAVNMRLVSFRKLCTDEFNMITTFPNIQLEVNAFGSQEFCE
jgi:hypothetical protein